MTSPCETTLRAAEEFSLETWVAHVSALRSQKEEWGRRYCMKNNNNIPVHTCIQLYILHVQLYLLHCMASNIYYATKQKAKTWPYSCHCLYIQMNITCKLLTSGAYTWTQLNLSAGTSCLYYRNNKTAPIIYLGLYVLMQLWHLSQNAFKKMLWIFAHQSHWWEINNP